MLITSPSNRYSLNRMNSFETIVTPVRRNVARKSTANRPLFNTILKHPFDNDDLNDFTTKEKIITEPFNISDYPSYKNPDFSSYFNNDEKITSKRSTLSENENYDSQHTMDFINDSENMLSNEDSDEEKDTSGIFCVSESMAKYLDDVFLSPSTNYDSSDESIDLSRVKNYPVKLEKYDRCEETTEHISNKHFSSPSKEFGFDEINDKKQEMLADCVDTNEHVIASNDPNIDSDCDTKELGIQTKKCLFDPNLQSVTCKVKVREEVLLCENVPLKMTILEANFDAEQLENKVEESNYDPESDDVKDNGSSIPQVICAMSLGSEENNMDETLNSDDVEKKKKSKKPKKVTFKFSEPVMSNEVHDKRKTRSQLQVSNVRPKRITRNSARLNRDSSPLNEDVSDINNLSIVSNDENFYNDKSASTGEFEKLCDEKPRTPSVVLEKHDETPRTPSVVLEKLDDFTNDENPRTPSIVLEKPDDFTNDEKFDCKKKCSLDKKSKKEINEGVLLHVEATKETELMRDGKIVKEKEEYLKDIESKIDKNLPVVVEKEFDIQQSLTEEILLDQVLRSSNQRTSPRLSKIVKEAILKAAVKKPASKAKQQKIKKNKFKSKGKNDKSLPQNREESETTDSTLNNSATSESASDVSSNSELTHKSVDKKSCINENNPQKKKKDNYVVATVIKNTNEEKVVEPLTIKICRKNIKKKSGPRLSLKKKRSPKKKDDAITKPVRSKSVNMDDLSKTFEDVLQDDSWCSDEKLNGIIEENFVDNEKSKINSSSSKLPCKNGTSTQKSIDKTKDNNIGTQHSASHKTEALLEKDVDNSNLTNRGNEEIGNQIASSGPENLSSATELPVNISESITSELNGVDTGSTPLKDSIKFGENLAEINKNNSFDKTLLSTLSKDTYECRNDVAQSDPNSTKLVSDGSIVNNIKINSVDPSDFSEHLTTSQSTTLDSPTIKPHPSGPSGFSDSGIPLLNGSPQRSLHTTPNYTSNAQQITSNSHLNSNQTISIKTQSYQEPALEQPKCLLPSPTPITDLPPKVVPLSIASRDPRLRKSHVQLVLNVNTSSVSNSTSEKTEIRQETRIISHVIENFSRDIDDRRDSVMETFTKDIDERINPAINSFSKVFDSRRENISRESDSRSCADSDTEGNENLIEMERKKRFRKKEVDAELLYKTPLSDLHEVPERTSYNRSIRKRSPPKIDKRDPKSSRWKDGNYSTNSERTVDPYGEYHETNMVYSRITHSSVRRPLLNSEEPLRNEGFYPDYRNERLRPEPYPPEHYSSLRNDDYYQDARRRGHYTQNTSSEYIHEVRHSIDFPERHSIDFPERRSIDFPERHSIDFPERHSVHQNLSDLRRSGYHEPEHEFRHSENHIPDHMPPENNYSRGYKRPIDFCSDQVHRESPDYRDKELGRERISERNQSSHNEPSYSRWDYAHKKVDGYFPAGEDDKSKKEEISQPHDKPHMWDEVRDLIDGPVKNFTRPFYRRKKFSRGEELFERRRFPEESDRNYERPWVRKTDQELIHGPERDRWERRGRKGFRDIREERSRSPRRDHERYPRIRSRSPLSYHKIRREASPSPSNSPLVLDSPMSPEPDERYSVLEPTKCLTIPQ